MKNLILLASFMSAFTFVGCSQNGTPETPSTPETPIVAESNTPEQIASVAKRVSQDEFKQALNEEVILIDVRTADEYSAGHIDGAINHDFLNGDFSQALTTLDKSKKVLIYCKSGGRSGRALEEMKAAGFSNVLELEGGFSSWK